MRISVAADERTGVADAVVEALRDRESLALVERAMGSTASVCPLDTSVAPSGRSLSSGATLCPLGRTAVPSGRKLAVVTAAIDLSRVPSAGDLESGIEHAALSVG
jgi:hypothetical protein